MMLFYLFTSSFVFILLFLHLYSSSPSPLSAPQICDHFCNPYQIYNAYLFIYLFINLANSYVFECEWMHVFVWKVYMPQHSM